MQLAVVALLHVAAVLLGPYGAEAAKVELGTKPKGLNPLLYSVEKDPIVQLDADTFSDTVLAPNRTRAYMVEYYKDWCGYCRNFVPFFKVFAVSVKDWPFVTIAAINCADAYNVKICRANNIPKVPRMKYFPRSAQTLEDAIMMKHSNDSTETAIEVRANLHEMMLAEFKKESEKGTNEHYLNQLPYKKMKDGENDDAWASTPGAARYLVSVFEEDVKKGLHVTMELMMYRPHVEVRRMLVKSAGGKGKYGYGYSKDEESSDMELPYIEVLKRGKQEPLLKESLSDKTLPKVHELLKALKEEVNKTEMEQANYAETVNTTDCGKEAEKCKEMFFVSESDMLKSIYTALLGEIISSGGDALDTTRIEGLKGFLELLIQRFPRKTYKNTPMDYHPKAEAYAKSGKPLSRSENAIKVFEQMKKLLEDKGSNGNVTMDEWTAEFEKAQKTNGDPFPVRASWEHCNGTREIDRGFTCGMWVSFHTMLTNAYLGEEKDPLKPLKQIQGWVANFFSCSGCRTHFMEMTTEKYPMTVANVKKPEDVVLYLWKAHNTVNKRLHGNKASEDPQFTKEQFPPPYLCKDCQAQSNAAGEAQLDEAKTLPFLLKYYTEIKAASA